MAKNSLFDRWHDTVAHSTETELRRLRVRVPQNDPNREAKLRMIDKRLAILHGFLGA